MLSCDCDFDTPEWLNETWRTARKEHRCEECGKKIQPGERYWRQVSKQDGDILVAKDCEHCFDLWDNLTDLGYCRYTGGVLFDALEMFYDESTTYNEERDEWTLRNGRTVREQVDRLHDISRGVNI